MLLTMASTAAAAAIGLSVAIAMLCFTSLATMQTDKQRQERAMLPALLIDDDCCSLSLV